MKFTKYIKILGNGFNSNRLVRYTIWHKIIRKLFGEKIAAKKYEIKDKKIHFCHQFDIDKWEIKEEPFSSFGQLYDHYCRHEFNLLGTSFIKWEAGSKVLGFQDYKVCDKIPKSESYDTVKKNTTSGYCPISWNVDVKTGYMFQKLYYDSTLIENLPKGVDIKVPWELGRMYHWCQLAFYSLWNKDCTSYILTEFKNQMMDFMISNPIGKGVHFYCAMEAAIRAINLLIAYDLLSQVDSTNILDSSFQKKFEQYIYMHGTVIIHNMEYDYLNRKSGNHYLTDICGLLWISLYFPSKRTKKWQDISKRELLSISKVQFLPSGCNFECSTTYHRLTTELYTLSLIVLIKSNAIKFDITRQMKIKLKGMYDFLLLAAGEDGNLIQIGDNDSGSVLKLMPNYSGNKENTLNADFITSLIEALCQIEPLKKIELGYGIIKMLDIQKDLKKMDSHCLCSQGSMFESTEKNTNMLFQKEIYQNLKTSGLYKKKKTILLETGANFKETILKANLEFGLIKVSGHNIDFFIRTIPDYKRMELAHAHDDIFHFELCMNKKRYFSDKGSIVYTPSKKLRYEYSSSKKHNVPIHKNSILRRNDIFQAESGAMGKTIIEKNSITIIVKNNSMYHVRRFLFQADRVVIEDISNESFEVNYVSELGYSKGYGQLEEIN